MTPKALSREIKFRAFYKEENCMFYSCEVLEWVIWEFSCGEIKVVVQELGTEDKEWNVKDLPIMQFTGLHDKNGKEIWEGDIIKYDDDESLNHWVSAEVAQILFIPARFTARMKPFDKFDGSNQNMLGDDFGECVNVIGNIYENPELLN